MVYPDSRPATRHFYAVPYGNPLHEKLAAYDREARAFVEHAERIVACYRADKAVALHLDFNIRVWGLEFSTRHAPLSWQQDPQGAFYPHGLSKAYNALSGHQLPHLWTRIDGAPYDMNYGRLGHYFIVSALAGPHNTVRPIAGADPLTAEEFAQHRIAASAGNVHRPASEEDQWHADTMGRQDWLPPPLFHSKLFASSQETVQPEQERLPAALRAVQRGLSYLGRACF